MTDSKPSDWRKQFQLLYLVSLIAWAVAASVSLANVLTSQDHGSYIASPRNLFICMLEALPGILYFFIQSRRLTNADPIKASKIAGQVMIIQHITGAMGVAGAGLGLIPFAINFYGFLISKPSDMWLNVGTMVPWISLYGFVTTYIIAMRINRRRLRSE